MTSSRRRHRFGIVAGCTLLVAGAHALIATPAHAQRSAADIETARQLYNQGTELRDKGDMRGALEKLRAAHALGNTPITGLELCKTHAALAQPVEAREVCLGVGRIPPLAGETSRSVDARNEAARVAEEMKPKISVVRLHITGVPPGREPTVVVDGAPIPNAALGEARAVNPGKHDIVARIGSGPETRSSFDLGPGESKDVTLPVQAPLHEDAPIVGPQGPYQGERPPPRERTNGLAVAGFVTGGVGVGIGLITGIIALVDKSDLDSKCTDKICGRPDHSALDSAQAMGNVSTAAFIVGGVGLAVGLYASLSAQRSSGQATPPRAVGSTRATLTPDFGPGGVGVHGAF